MKNFKKMKIRLICYIFVASQKKPVSDRCDFSDLIQVFIFLS